MLKVIPVTRPAVAIGTMLEVKLVVIWEIARVGSLTKSLREMTSAPTVSIDIGEL